MIVGTRSTHWGQEIEGIEFFLSEQLAHWYRNQWNASEISFNALSSFGGRLGFRIGFKWVQRKHFFSSEFNPPGTIR
jgi:hypothetical protein